MRTAAVAAALLAVAPALVVAAPPPLAVAAQNGPYATTANEDVSTLTPSVNGCVYTEYYWRSLPVSQLPLQTITLGTTTLTPAQITEIFQRGAGCCDEDQTIDFAYYYISALENIANGAALPSNVAAALAVVNNTFNNFNIFCNPNLVGPDQKNPEAATEIIHLYNFGQYAPAGSCQDEVTPNPLQKPYPARQNFTQHTVNPTCTVSTPTPAPTTVVVTPAPTTTKAPTPAPTTVTAAPTTVATPAPTTTAAPTPAPTTVTAAPTTVATPAPTTTQAPTPAPTTVTPAPTTTSIPTVIRGTPAPTTAATSTPIVVNLPTTPPNTGAFQIPTTVAATPAPTTVATPAPTTAATTAPQTGAYTPPTQCPSGNVCAPVGAISAFNNSVQQYQCYPNGAYVSSTGAAVVPAVPCIPQGNNGTALQCPVQYDGPRAPLGVQDYVCYVYDPFRAEAPWAGSQSAYAQCYNPDEQICTSTNFLCPVSAPLACGRACFNPLQYQCVVNQQNFFNSYLQLQKSSLSGTTCPPQPTNGCPTTTPTSQPPTGALIPPTVTPTTVTPAPTTAATPAPTTVVIQTLPPATPAPTTAATPAPTTTTIPSTGAFEVPTTTLPPIIITLPPTQTPAPTTAATPAPTTTAAPTPAPTTTAAPTPAPTTVTPAPTTVATPAPTTTQAPTPAPTTVTPAPTTTIIVTPAPTTTTAPTPAPTTTAAPTTVPATTKPATTKAATTAPSTTRPATTTPATGPIVIGTTAPATTAPATATVCPTGYPNPGTTGSLVVENPRGTDSCPAPTHLCTEDRYYYLYANASAFAAQELTLGHITYNVTGQQELLRIGDQNGFDQSYNLAYQLIPVLQNLARGTKSTPELEQIIDNAQAYLDKYPPGSPQAEAGTVGCTQTGFEQNAVGLFLYNCGYLPGSPGGCPGTTCQGAENNPHHGGDYTCIGGSSSLYKFGKMRF